MSNLNERLDCLKQEIQTPEFLESNGLSNEVNIRIFCYDPADKMKIRYFVEKIVVDQSLNCHLIEKNLYKVFLSICDDKRITDKAPQMEERKTGIGSADPSARRRRITSSIIRICRESA